MSNIKKIYLLYILIILINIKGIKSFTFSPLTRAQVQEKEITNLYSTQKQKEEEEETYQTALTTARDIYIDEDSPVEVVGAEVFGGRAEKETLFDPVAESNAAVEDSEQIQLYLKFQDENAFAVKNEEIKELIIAYQLAMNSKKDKNSLFSSNFNWESPLFDKNSKNPLVELEQAKEFYQDIHVSLISAQEISDSSVKVKWEICVVWPTFYSPRVLLSGSSTLSLDSAIKITKQVDELDHSSSDYISNIASQLVPRFWDLYHIGMTPSAQLLPRFPLKSSTLFPPNYEILKIPSALFLNAKLPDSTRGRNDRLAQSIPNHAFSTVIKTVGSNKQAYVPTSPVEIHIKNNIIEWFIYVPTSISCLEKQLLATDGEAEYKVLNERIVAIVPFGGSPQDVEISSIRKELYETILNNEKQYKPKLDPEQGGKPIFFYWQGNAKACFVEQGLGMAVYDYRPKFSKSHAIGIELELK